LPAEKPSGAFLASPAGIVGQQHVLTGVEPAAADPALLLEAGGEAAMEELAGLFGERDPAVGQSAEERSRLWSYRERHPEAAGLAGTPIKLDVSVPAAHWTELASRAADEVTRADQGATVITFGHVADGNVHVNIVPAADADGRHEDAVLSLVASLGGSVSAEHGIGALKARWLGLSLTSAATGPPSSRRPPSRPRRCPRR
jgi:FAD/FMN-containing dehydrogenase